jgi:outer membrane protein
MKLSVRLILAIATLTALGSAPVRAAELTLDDCIDLALKNRAAIIAARGQEQVSKATERAALGAFLPNVSASYDYTKEDQRHRTVQGLDSTGASVTQDLPNLKFTNKQTNIGGSLNFTLPDVWFSYIASRVDHESSRLDVIASEQDMILAVKTAYYSYLAAVQNVSVADETVKRSEEQLKLIQSKYDLGSAALSDVLKQKVQYGNDRLTQLQAQNSVANARASLAFTIGLDPRQDTQFATSYLPRTYEGTMDDAINFGLSHRPSLLSQEKSLQSSKYRLNSSLSGYFPKVTPFASYGYSRSTGVNPATYSARTTSQQTLTYGFGLSLNIFDGFAREQRVSQAKMTRNNASAQLADLRNQVASDIKTSYLNIQALKEQKKVTDETVASASEDLKITQEKYTLGAATILDLLNAQVSLKQAEQSQIQAGFDLNLAVSRLENAMGKM